MLKKPHILYIPADRPRGSFRHRLINQGFYTGQDGYFEEALEVNCRVTRISPERFFTLRPASLSSYDALVVNWKCGLVKAKNERSELLREIASRANIPRVLFVGSDQARGVPSDRVLDAYDIVWKREPYRDRGQYDLSSANQQKLRPSMLVCPLVMSPRRWWSRMIAPWARPQVPPASHRKTRAVFFSGAVIPSNPLRTHVLSYLRRSGVDLSGGLQTKFAVDTEVPEELRCPKLTKPQYLQAIRSSKINLALEGIGEFTFRHLELWYLGEFMISSPSIRELELLLPAKEGTHYVSYDSLEELADKIRYYLEHDGERERIARAGREMFERYYSPQEHGKEFVHAINKAEPI